MNANRRKALYDLVEELDGLTAHKASLEALSGLLDDITGEEQDAFDNTPESLQNDTALEALADALMQIDDAINSINSARE